MPYLVQGAAIAPPTTTVMSSSSFRRIIILLTALALAVTLIAIEAPTATLGATASGQRRTRSEAQRVVKYARSHIGARFRIGTEGRRYFDCSGLVFRVYAQAGLLRRIGGGTDARCRLLQVVQASRPRQPAHPKTGDLIWWTQARPHRAHRHLCRQRSLDQRADNWRHRRHAAHGRINVKFWPTDTFACRASDPGSKPLISKPVPTRPAPAGRVVFCPAQEALRTLLGPDHRAEDPVRLGRRRTTRTARRPCPRPRRRRRSGPHQRARIPCRSRTSAMPFDRGP